MHKGFLVQNALLGVSALLVAGAHFATERDHTGPVLNAAVTFVKGADTAASLTTPTVTTTADGEVAGVIESAVNAFAGVVRGLSRPEALETAFVTYRPSEVAALLEALENRVGTPPSLAEPRPAATVNGPSTTLSFSMSNT